MRSFVLLIAALVAAPVLALAASTWGAPGTQANTRSDATVIMVDQDSAAGGVLFADGTFEQAAVGAAGDLRDEPLILRRTAAGGFGAPQRLAGDQSDVATAISMHGEPGGRAVATWLSHDTIRVATRGTDGSWSLPVTPLEARPGNDSSETCFGPPRAASLGGGAAVVLAQCTVDGEVSPVWASRQSSSGTWSTPQALQPLSTEGRVWDLEVASDGTAWALLAAHSGSRYDITVRRLAPSASTWDTPETVATAVELTDDRHPADLAVADDGSVAVVWSASYDVQIRARSTAGAWAAPYDLTPGGTGFDQRPRVTADLDGVFHVVWASGDDTTDPDAVLWSGYRLPDTPGGGDAASLPASIHDAGANVDDLVLATTARGDVVAAMIADTSTHFLRPLVTVLEAGASTWSPVDDIGHDGNDDVAPSIGWRIGIATDDAGDAAISWVDQRNQLQVTPYDVTAPAITSISVPAQATVGSRVTFSLAASDTWSDVASVEWEVDGGGYRGATVQHVFQSPGAHIVIATVEDTAGNAANIVRAVDVAPAPAPPPTDTTDGGTPPPPPPVDDAPKFDFISTVSRDRMPALVGLTVSQARDRVDRAGIEGDFELTFVSRNTAPRGIKLGDVMTQRPAAGTRVTSAIRSAAPIRLQVYAGPARLKGTKAGCTTTRIASAVRGMELDLARLVLREMRCPFRLDVRAAGAADPTVGAITAQKGKATLAVTVPKQPRRNDLFVIVREMQYGMSFDSRDWTLTAGERNAVTFQVVDRAFRLVKGARLTVDGRAVGALENLNGSTNGNGERPLTLLPTRAGIVDVLVEATGADGESIYGVAQLRVVDRSRQKVGSVLTTTAGRQFRKEKSGRWVQLKAGAKARRADGPSGRFIDFGGMLRWVQDMVKPLLPSVQATYAKGGSPQEVLRTGLARHGLAPAQLLGSSPLASGNVRPAVVDAGKVVAVGGGNVVAVGGGNIALPTASVVAVGGGNVVAVGGGNVVAVGGGNAIVLSGAGVVAVGGGNVVSVGGGNVVAVGGGNVVSVGGGNVVAVGGGNLIATRG